MEMFDVVGGMWKFSDSIPIHELVELAEQWRNEDPKYIRLSIRGCGENMQGIEFLYEFEGHSYRSYFHKVGREMQAKFGKRFVGWDVSSPVWLIK